MLAIFRRIVQFKMFMHLFYYFLRKPGTVFCGTLSSPHCTTSALISQLPTSSKCSDTRIAYLTAM